MPDTKKLTVAIPTFDREDYLRAALQSVANQTERSFKVILFDNASHYDTGGFITEFPNLNIIIEKSETNIGNYANFSRLFGYSYDTPYVIALHDDDTVHPRYFADALAILENDPEIAWVGSLIKYTRDSAKMFDFAALSAPAKVDIYSKQKLSDVFMSDKAIGYPTVIYRRESLQGVTLDTERFYKWNDRPFMLETIGQNKAAVLNFPYLNYRIHQAQDSAQPYREHLPEMINLISYLHSTGTPGRERDIFATTSALRTAAINCVSPVDFFTILKRFSDRGIYQTSSIRLPSLLWLVWLLTKRLRQSLLKR